MADIRRGWVQMMLDTESSFSSELSKMNCGTCVVFPQLRINLRQLFHIFQRYIKQEKA